MSPLTFKSISPEEQQSQYSFAFERETLRNVLYFQEGLNIKMKLFSLTMLQCFLWSLVTIL